MATPPDPPSSTAPVRSGRVTLPELAKMAREGRKIAMLTSYDASFAAICDRVGIDTLLVGDSLGMVVQGHPTTLPVTLEQTLYHTRCVVAGASVRW